MKLKALKHIPNSMITGLGTDSRRTERGTEFELGGVRARRLVALGYAEQVDKPAAGPAETKIDATDSAVKLAKEHNINLGAVKGTGANGRITKADVQKVIE